MKRTEVLLLAHGNQVGRILTVYHGKAMAAIKALLKEGFRIAYRLFAE